LKFYCSSLYRWLAAGFAFLFINSVFMLILVEFFQFHTFWATLISAELCTILRFFVNEHWVFRVGGPFWRRLWQYHLANAASFIVWMTVANTLIAFGMHYLLASVAAVCVSVVTSLVTNFLWVWRHRQPPYLA
jgi:putative flippase GtrA